ncbi:PleD family two-component system response regulator, partial [Candidatus Hydrogenedentota bacterium]
IFLGLDMPATEALDIVKSLKKCDETKDIPIVLTSAWSNAERIDECLQAGADGFLHKPTDINEVMGAAREYGRRMVGSEVPDSESSDSRQATLKSHVAPLPNRTLGISPQLYVFETFMARTPMAVFI